MQDETSLYIPNAERRGESAMKEAILMILQEAYNMFLLKKYNMAAEKYQTVHNLISKSGCKDEYINVDIIQYMMCKSLIESNNRKDLEDALELLLDLEQNKESVLPMVYYALAKIHIKFFRFNSAVITVNKGLAVLKTDTKFQLYYIPGTNELIHESTQKNFLTALMKLKEECTSWHRPDATCTMINCQNYTEYYPPCRTIFFSDPAFTGMVTVMCNNVPRPCKVKFHQSCWKFQKEQMSLLEKLTDETIIGLKCLTPNCQTIRVPNKITKIEYYNKDGNIEYVIETPITCTRSPQKASLKGAIKKKSKESQDTIQLYKNEKMYVTEEEIVWRTRKLNMLRKENFGIVIEENWQPDKQFYGNETVMTMLDFELNINISGEDDKIVNIKTFVFELFYEYIKLTGPLSTDDVLTKWGETKELIDNYDFVFDEYLGVVEFLLQSPKIAKIGHYMCITHVLPETYALLKSNTLAEFKNIVNDKVETNTSRNDIKDYMNHGNPTVTSDSTTCKSFQPLQSSMIIDKQENGTKYATENGRNRSGNGFNAKCVEVKDTYRHNNKQRTNMQMLQDFIKNKSKPVSQEVLNFETVDAENFQTPVKWQYQIEHSTPSNKMTPFLQYNNVQDKKKHVQNESESVNSTNNNVSDYINEVEHVSSMDDALKKLFNEFAALIQSNNSSDDYLRNWNADTTDNGNLVTEDLQQELFNCDFMHADVSTNVSMHNYRVPDVSSKLELLNQEKDFLVEQNQALRKRLEKFQSFAKTVLSEYKALKNDESILKRKVSHLLQEKQETEHNMTLLLLEKNKIMNAYEENSKTLYSKWELKEEQLNQKAKQLDMLKLESFDMKKIMLHKYLDIQYSTNKDAVIRNIQLCNMALETINKINFIFERNFGFCALSDNIEWLRILNGFHEVQANHEKEYWRLKSLLESNEHILQMNDVALRIISMPPLPSRPLSEAVIDAFNKYSVLLMRTLRPYPVPPAVPILGTKHVNVPNIYISELPTYVHSSSTPLQHASYLNNVEKNKNTTMKEGNAFDTNNNDNNRKDIDNSKTDNAKQIQNHSEDVNKVNESTIEYKNHCTEDIKKFSNNTTRQEDVCELINRETRNMYDIEENNIVKGNVSFSGSGKTLEEIKNDALRDDVSETHQNNVISITQNLLCEKETKQEIEHNQNSLIHINETSGKCCNNLDRVMLKLRMKYSGIMELDLLESLMSVRREHRDSLSGLPVQKILQQAGEYILKCQEKYLCCSVLSEENLPMKNKTFSTNKIRKQDIKSQGFIAFEPSKKKASKSVPSKQILTKLTLNTNVILKQQTLHHQNIKLNSASSDSTGPIANNSTTTNKCAWNPIPQSVTIWKKEDQETECIICMENIKHRSGNVYTLTCQHTFHKTCIKSWFQQNQSCPTCRVHCTMDDDFPPLPS